MIRHLMLNCACYEGSGKALQELRSGKHCERDCALSNCRQGQAKARRRHKRSFRGALNNSRRQAEYKRWCKEEATHHGSPEPCQDAIFAKRLRKNSQRIGIPAPSPHFNSTPMIN